MILLFISGCAATFKEKRELSRPLVSIAMGKIQNNDIQGALIELRRAARGNPDDPEVYYGFALAYWKSRKSDKALENIEMSIKFGNKLDLEHPGLKSEVYNLKGIILIGKEHYDQAIEAFETALKDELYATPEYALHNMASVYLTTRQYDKALTAANQALEKNIHYAPTWELTGRIFIEQGNDTRAVEAFKHAVLEFPGYTEAHLQLAQTYLRQGNIDSAAEHLKEVVRLDNGGIMGEMAEQRLYDLGIKTR